MKLNQPLFSLRFALAPAALFSFGMEAQAQISFSVDWHGPTVSKPDSFSAVPITEGDILVPATSTGLPALGPLATPGILISAGAGGLGLAGHAPCVGHPGGTPCRVELDALSRGIDRCFMPQVDIAPGTLRWSTDEMAGAAPILGFPSLVTEFPVGDSSADVWTNGMPLPSPPLMPFILGLPTVGVVDGDGLPSASGALYPGTGLVEPNLPGPPPDLGDNLDALDEDFFDPTGFPSAIYYSLDSGYVDPCIGVPNSGSAAFHGFTPADVIVTTVPGAAPMLYAPAAALGLGLGGAQNDLDALILCENGIAGFQPSHFPFDWVLGGTDMLIFSVRRGSPVIGMPDSIFGAPIEEGDLLIPPVVGGVSPFPGIWIAAEIMNLGTLRSGTLQGACNSGDDLNAADYIQNPLFDCNGNGVEDAVDILLGFAADANGNGIPDSCETFLDCNGNGIDDTVDIASGTSADCNGNGIPDECDIADGTSADCNGDGIPDECQPDCNGNGIPDDCDISAGTSFDCNGDGVPDECQLIATPYCYGVGCPCFNDDASAGCVNGSGVGALLTASGTSVHCSDGLVLTATSLPLNKFGIMFMGGAPVSIPFGNGLRCVASGGAGLWRFGIKNSGLTGTITEGPPIIAFHGVIAPASTWYFQCWYRDPAGPCGGGFNVSNAVEVVFIP